MTDNQDIMRPLKGEVERGRYAVIDIETKDGNTQKAGFTRPFLVGYYDGESYFDIYGDDCLEKMLAFMLTDANDGKIFYAHNGGGFDWLHFLPYIQKRGFSYEILTVGSTIQMLQIKRKKESHRKGWRFLDSMKLIPTSLEKACKAFNVQDKKMADFDYNLHEKDPLWREYLELDCISLYQVLTRFHDLVEITLGGEVGITAASTSMRTFRRSYQKQNIQRHSPHHKMFRDAYYGGRVEIHRKTGKNLKYYDINSAYPFAMLRPMPVGEAMQHKGAPPREYLNQDKYVGFARARVEYPEDCMVPCLPSRDEETKRLIFPVGRLKGTWSAIELLRAEEQGATIHWEDSIWIRARPVLAGMVEDLYAFRDKARPDYDEGLAQTAKILLNSLYGKFGMQTGREKIIILNEGEKPPTENVRPADPKDPDCRIWYLEEECDAPYVIPQIAAYVTSLARLTLHDYLVKAHEGGELAYCDTDSVITSANLDEYCGSELGKIKDEGDGEIWEGEFLQPKVYCLKGDRGGKMVAMKGYRKEKQSDGKYMHTIEKYERVRRGEVISFEALEKIGAMAKKGFIDGPQKVIITRQLNTQDKKRQYLPDGSTRPLIIDQW